MARLDLSGVAQHVIQRGNNRQICFGSEEDFAAYVDWLREYSVKHSVGMHAWFFMTNHVHLLVAPKELGGSFQVMPSSI